MVQVLVIGLGDGTQSQFYASRHHTDVIWLEVWARNGFPHDAQDGVIYL
ncbi:MAG: hypothetical protein AAB211_03100 [Pseudomonadota bacterium]